MKQAQQQQNLRNVASSNASTDPLKSIKTVGFISTASVREQKQRVRGEALLWVLYYEFSQHFQDFNNAKIPNSLSFSRKGINAAKIIQVTREVKRQIERERWHITKPDQNEMPSVLPSLKKIWNIQHFR